MLWQAAPGIQAPTERIMLFLATHDTDRATAWSRQLAHVHAVLRQQLQDLQAGLGHGPGDGGLQMHCLAFCSALSTHHAGEDTGMFAELLRVRPDLRDTVRKLTEDHQMIASILATVSNLAREAGGAAPARQEEIRQELGGLAAIMESHFGYEERALSTALDDGVPDTGWATAVFQLES